MYVLTDNFLQVLSTKAPHLKKLNKKSLNLSLEENYSLRIVQLRKIWKINSNKKYKNRFTKDKTLNKKAAYFQKN